MQIVYLAGPYRADTREGIEQNIQTARKAAIALWERGYGVICPHLNTAHFGDDCKAPESAYLEAYLKMVDWVDKVILLPGWAKSEGTRAEYQRARDLGIPVLGIWQILPDLPDWNTGNAIIGYRGAK